MSDDLNTELRFGADTTGAEAGVNRVKRSLKDLGDSANKASKDAGDSLGRVGVGGDKAAKDVDRATKTMQSSLQRVIASFEGGEKGSRQFYESLARQRNVDVNTLKPLLDQLDAVKAKSQAAAQASVQVGSSFTGLSAAAGLAARAFAVIGVGASVGEFVRLADASTNVASRLGLVTNSAAELASVQQRLFSIAQSSRGSFVDLVGTYAQVARSTKDLGVSQTALLGVIQTISQAVTISGGSAASAQAALTQLSQGFASGALRGEELNSILEQTPRLAQALADGLGVGVGKLRELGQAGELTSEKVLGALEKSAASVAAEFGKMAVTVEQASTNAANSALKLVGALDKITGASSATAGGITRLSAGMDALTLNIERLSSSKGLSDFFFLAFNNERSLNGELEITQKELAGLEARLAKAPSNIYTRSAVAEMREYVKELKEAQARLAALSGQSGPTDPRDQSGFTGRGASYANEAKRQAKLAEDANSFRLNQAGVPASYLKDMAELIRLNQAGVIVGKEYTDALKKQQDILLKKTGVTKGASASAKQEVSEYDKLIKKLSDELPKAAAEAEAAQMGYNKSQTEFLALAGSDVWAKFSNSERARVASLYEGKIASEQAGEAAKELSKAYAEAAAERIKTIQSMERAADGLQSQNDALREEIELIGLSTEQQTLVLQQRNDVIILTKEATLAELERQSAITGTQTRVEIALASEIDALKERNALLGAKGIKEAAKQAESEWARSVEKYEDIFRQGFADMLNNGKDGWESFTKSLVTTFKTTVADQIYKMFAQPFVVKLIGSFLGFTGVSGVANAATGGGDVIGTASNVGSAYRAATGFNTGWLTDFGSTLPGSIASTGANLYSQGFETVGSSMMDFGNSIAGYADAINVAGDVLGYGAAVFAAANGKWGQAIGSAVGTYFGGPIGSFIGSTIGKWADKIFSGGAGTPHSGGGLIYSAANGIRGGAENYNGQNFGMGVDEEYNPEVEKLIGPLAIGLVTTLDGVAKTFGKTAGYEIATAFADDSSDDGAWGSLRISKDGQELLNWRNTQTSRWAPKEFANGEEGYKEYLAAIAKDTRTVLLDMDLPSWADTMLESIGDAANMDQLAATVQQIGAIQTTFVQLGKTMEGFAGLTDKAFEALMKYSGGIESLSANASAFYSNDLFYSEGERAAKATQMLTEELGKFGAELPSSGAAYRALFQQQLDAGEGGAELAAVLLRLAPAFAQVTESAANAQKRLEEERQQQLQQQANASKSARDSAYSALENAITREREALEVRRDLAAESVDTLTGIFETIRGNVRELYGEVGSTAAMQVSQANAFIDQALRNAQTTGYMPDSAKLSEAIGTARSGLSNGAYTSQFEADRDRLVLAGKLAALGEISGEQLTTAERQLKYSQEQIEQLDETLDYWREQIDIANGTYEATLSVADAIGKLQDLMFPGSTTPGKSTAPTGPQYAGVQGGGTEWKFGMGYATDPANFQEEFNYGRGPSSKDVFDADKVSKLTSLRSMLQAEYGAGTPEDLTRIASLAKSSGASMADIGAALGFWESDIRKIFEGAGIPAFAVGTNYVQRDMLAQIHEGEAIVPKAYNPAANPGMAGSGTARLEALIEKLTAKVEQLEGAARATASNTAGLPQMVDQFDTVTNGGNAMRTKALA